MTPAPKSPPPVTVPPKHWLRPQPPRPLSAEMVMLFRYCVRHSSAQIKKVSQDLTLAADIFCLVEGGASLPSSVRVVQLRAGFAAGARRWRRRRLGDLPRICAAIAEVVVYVLINPPTCHSCFADRDDTSTARTANAVASVGVVHVGYRDVAALILPRRWSAKRRRRGVCLAGRRRGRLPCYWPSPCPKLLWTRAGSAPGFVYPVAPTSPWRAGSLGPIPAWS